MESVSVDLYSFNIQCMPSTELTVGNLEIKCVFLLSVVYS